MTDGTTPLMIASDGGYNDIVQLLLEWNVLINTQTNNGATAIGVAFHKGHSSLVFTLLNNSTDPKLSIKKRSNTLMAANFTRS